MEGRHRSNGGDRQGDALPGRNRFGGLQHAFAAISPSTTMACFGCFKLGNTAALPCLLAATAGPKKLTKNYCGTNSDGSKLNLPPMMMLGSQPWIGKPSAPQCLQVRRLRLSMVVLCPNQMTTIVVIVQMQVAKLKNGSTTTTTMAVGGEEESGSASMQGQPCP